MVAIHITKIVLFLLYGSGRGDFCTIFSSVVGKTLHRMRDCLIVIVTIAVMVYLLIKEYLRPGLILFSAVILLLATGVITTTDALAGFSNKGVITVALLFLVSEGIRASGCLMPLMKQLFPRGEAISTRRGYIRVLPTVAFISAFLNNTPIVVIFIPHVKVWCRKVGISAKKLLIPLSYAAILGGMCTLIGTSTNLVVHGMMIDAGLEGFTLFELGKVGVIVAIAGTLYMILFIGQLLPNDTAETDRGKSHIAEVVLGPRFPGIECTVEQFNFYKHYGAHIISVRRDGRPIESLEEYCYKENDTLLLSTDRNFVTTWSGSSIFLVVTNGTEQVESATRWRQWLSLALVVVMVVGASSTQSGAPDMFFWAASVAVVMAFTGIFQAKRYTKFISWDILITIASAFAISRAMVLSGLADTIAASVIALCNTLSPHVVLAIVYIITNIITEIITNNAAAAFALPIAISAATQLTVSPMPFCVAIAIAASASFCTPIGYQTNTIVQGLGGYRFRDFLRAGLPLTAITFIVSMIFIPIFWKF